MLETRNDIERKKGKYRKELTKKSVLYQQFSHWLINSFNKIPSTRTYNLTISKSHKLIWFRVAKVGSRTILDILDQAEVQLNAEHTQWCYYAVNDYPDYFKFAFIRNPWDRLVSCWLNRFRNKPMLNNWRFSRDEWNQFNDFNYFLAYVAKLDLSTHFDPHLRLQSSLIDLNNIDFLGRFERFEKDLVELMAKLKIENIKIPNLNPSPNRKHYTDYYNEETMQKVADIYKKDIQLFNYCFLRSIDSKER